MSTPSEDMSPGYTQIARNEKAVFPGGRDRKLQRSSLSADQMVPTRSLIPSPVFLTLKA